MGRARRGLWRISAGRWSMNRELAGFTLVLFLVTAFAGCAQPPVRKADFAVAPVPYKDVQVADSFWTPRMENNRNVSIPGMLERSDKSGRNPESRLLEAACYVLATHPDPALRSRLDGYLDRSIERIRSRKQIWSSEGDGDFFAAGNFLELGVAYYEATGSRKMLDVAIEIADDLDSVFGPAGRHDISNHEGIKIGLLRLYRATGNDRYLRLARFFLDTRGNPASRSVMYGPYAQDHAPVKSQPRAIGHSVRATYLYTPLTEIAALTADQEYAQADERIWEDAVSKRTYLTGGIGSYRDEEDYGDDYDLPNLSAWNEICAAYGNVFWNQKLFLLRQDAKFIDVMERTLYNAFLVGVSLGGDTYLYQAPLRTYGAFARQTSFGPNCCPPNLARLLPRLGGLVYAQGDQGLYVNLFVGSKAEIRMKDAPVTVTQETKYPWEGAVKITLRPQEPRTFALFVRIPGWARNQPMPGSLYTYQPAPEKAVSLAVNGSAVPYTVEKGYARIEREWKAGDAVQLDLPMPVRRVTASEQVADDRGMVALERGPLVYCAEQADNPAGVFNLVLPDKGELQFTYRPDLLGGIGEIAGKAFEVTRGPNRTSIMQKEVGFHAIPYYAFSNRAAGEMSVWLAREAAKARIAPLPTIASTSRPTSSCGNGTVAENYPGNQPPTIARRFYPNSQDGSGDISAIFDQLEPANSEDGSAPFLRLHPQSGDQAWVQYDFARPAQVSSVDVYWKDDKQYCVLPAGWRLVYKEGNEWRPVVTAESYGVAGDRYNRISFQPVTTSALRIEIRLQAKVYKKGTLGPPDGNYLDQDFTWFEGGVIEWRVNPPAHPPGNYFLKNIN